MTIDDILKALRITRAEFRQVFQEAQRELPSAEQVHFEAVGRDADDTRAFRLALAHAEEHIFLDEFVKAVAGRFEDGELAHASLAKKDGKAAGELQGFLDRNQAGLVPEVFRLGIARALRSIVKVLVGGDFCGTGVLVSPCHVLTNWHVIKNVFKHSDDLKKFKRKRDVTLEVVFDSYLRVVPSGGTITGKEETVPCDVVEASASPCHPAQLNNQRPRVLKELDTHWDYAILKLAVPQFRPCFPLEQHEPTFPAAGSVILFHHPLADSQTFNVAEIHAPPVSSAAAVPRFRFLHKANTGPGSSGGPCFNAQFRFLGIHQGEWDKRKKVNCGVPISPIIEHLKQNGGLPQAGVFELPLPRLLEKDDFQPVIGLGSFLETAALIDSDTTNQRLLVLGGAKGHGKTFRVDALEAVLPGDLHLMVRLSASAITLLDPWGLVVRLTDAVGQAPPAKPDSKDHDSSNPIQLQLMARQILDTFDRARQGRKTWFLLTDLNHHKITNPHISTLLNFLYRGVEERKWFRVVLDGMEGELEPSLRSLRLMDEATPFVKNDIKNCLQVNFDDLRLADVHDRELEVKAAQLTRWYDSFRQQHPSLAAAGLQTLVRNELYDQLTLVG